VLRAFNRPLPVALLIGLLAQALFAWRLADPRKMFFDEVHYVPAARTLWALAGPANQEHPLLGKALIGLGMWIAGDGPVGWRILSTIAGTATVLGVFAILWLGLRRLRPAVLGSLFVLLNFLVFVQARIAMLDGFMGAFVVTGAACLLWAMRGERAWGRWIAGAVMLGLATATKWAAAPYVAFAATGFLLLAWRHPERWRGLPRIAAVSVLGLVSVATYFLTYLPALFYDREPLTLARVVPFQLEVLALQRQVLAPHTYQSDWWSWPLLIRPMWYFYEPVEGIQRGVFFVGNPAVMWGGLAAVAACGWAWITRRAIAPGAAAGAWLASFGIWAVIPKSLGFLYYYYLPGIWICIALAVAFDHWRTRLKGWDEAYLVAAFILFLHFYPILSAAPLSGPQAFSHWMWFSSWP
jgi:dolichyl-phosphate-mannose-protein mannosyltransferase